MAQKGKTEDIVREQSYVRRELNHALERRNDLANQIDALVAHLRKLQEAEIEALLK
jgi:hypothetical protein